MSGLQPHQRFASDCYCEQPPIACEQVHAEQLRHVEKGCLVRRNQVIASDGSRIEGSHKGWNSLQRSFASGIEIFTALCHDFVLRRNIRVALSHGTEAPFLKSAHGSHHLALVEHVHSLLNNLVKKDTSRTMVKLPELSNVASGETFGLVTSRHMETFISLVKCEDEGNNGILPIQDELEEEEILGNLDIDPVLRFQPANPGDGQVGLPVGCGEACLSEPAPKLQHEVEVSQDR